MTNVTKELLELIQYEKEKARGKALFALSGLFVFSLSIVGFFYGVSTAIPLSPLVFTFPVSLSLALLIMIVRLFL